LRDRTEPYNLGDNEFHLAMVVDDYDAALEFHKKMGCVCYENQAMGIYFIEDPDGYWVEIIPAKR
jgi:lactoylglutathione lyase